MLAPDLHPFRQFIAGMWLVIYPGKKNIFQRRFLAGPGFLQIIHPRVKRHFKDN